MEDKPKMKSIISLFWLSKEQGADDVGPETKEPCSLKRVNVKMSLFHHHEGNSLYAV